MKETYILVRAGEGLVSDELESYNEAIRLAENMTGKDLVPTSIYVKYREVTAKVVTTVKEITNN